LIVKLLGKPHERLCPNNTTTSEHKSETREKRDSDYDQEIEATFPPNHYDEGILKLETSDEVSTSCQVIKDTEHYKAIVEGRDGGTLTLYAPIPMILETFSLIFMILFYILEQSFMKLVIF